MNIKKNTTSISDSNVDIEITTNINTNAYTLAGWLEGLVADGWVAHGWMT